MSYWGRLHKHADHDQSSHGNWATLYHATHTEYVESIKRKGLLPMQTSNWVRAGDKERYGSGEVHAFESREDAVRWAAKMDWEFNKSMGTGKTSVVAFRGSGEWEVDESDPMSQAGSKGKWLRRHARVSAEDILEAIPVTSDDVRKLVSGKS